MISSQNPSDVNEAKSTMAANATTQPNPKQPEPVSTGSGSSNGASEGASDTLGATDSAIDGAVPSDSTASMKSGSEEAQDQAVQLINDFQDINFLHVMCIFCGAWLVIWTARRLLPLLAERSPSQARLYILNAVPIIRLMTMSLAILWMFPIIFNVTFENFLIIAGGASVAIGFAFKDYVSSLIAGIIAVFERPYRPGDWVKIGEDYGEVHSVGLRSLCLLTAADDLVTVPHTRIWEENISNANNGERTLMCVANFYVHPDHDSNAVRDVLQDVAMTSIYLEYSKPVLVVLAEVPLGTHYKVKAYPFDLRDQFVLISDLTSRGKEAIASVGGKPATAAYAESD